MKTKNKKLSLSKLLFEQTTPGDEIQTIPTDITVQQTKQPQNLSIDQKVDRYLIQYERESNPQAAINQDAGMNKAMTVQSSTQSVGAGFGGGQAAVATPVSNQQAIQERNKLKKQFMLLDLLMEQEEAPVDDMAGGDTGMDLGGDLGGGAEGGESTPAVSVPKPQINISVFANKIARLYSNFDSLINPKAILLNRVYAYIRQNYDENTAKELMVILENNYEISNMSIMDKEKSLVGEVPAAVGASGGGGGGGGA